VDQQPVVRFGLGDISRLEFPFEQVGGLIGHALPVVGFYQAYFLPGFQHTASIHEFLERQGRTPGEGGGEIVDREGRVLGRHEGVANFTVGQRRGLGVSSNHPLYVLGIEPAGRRVVVGGRDELLEERCIIERTRWIAFERPGRDLRARVRIRSNHEGADATVRDLGEGRAEIRFDDAQRAVTPGQAAVAYDGDLVLGGGWIAA
jgi:tRNA-specific 2-thiouridylase